MVPFAKKSNFLHPALRTVYYPAGRQGLAAKAASPPEARVSSGSHKLPAATSAAGQANAGPPERAPIRAHVEVVLLLVPDAQAT